jgi:CRISPR system Cascade subunit CasD
MQSWGVQSRFTTRDTGLEPSKSGVVGLLAAALGRPRHETVDDLAALRMGARVDREGSLERDFQTAQKVVRADGSGTQTVTSERYYLADADFLIGLEGDEALLRQLDTSLASPVWPLCLGRKAFPPGMPVRLPDAPPRGPGLRQGSLEEALEAYPWFRRDPAESVPEALRLVLEDCDLTRDGLAASQVRMDQPYGAAFHDRTFTVRAVSTRFVGSGAITVFEEG